MISQQDPHVRGTRETFIDCENNSRTSVTLRQIKNNKLTI